VDAQDARAEAGDETRARVTEWADGQLRLRQSGSDVLGITEEEHAEIMARLHPVSGAFAMLSRQQAGRV
jgi:hypothetical protein